ncbi:MAG: T9SS type A sorting domain-containing protein [Bacteroidota bacterium]
MDICLMKKTYPIYLIYLIFLFFFPSLTTAQQLPTNINRPQSRADYDAFNKILAETYAPEFRHQVELDFTPLGQYGAEDFYGIRDLFVAFDFDGDWIMHNNWEHYHQLRNGLDIQRLSAEIRGKDVAEIINYHPKLVPTVYYMVSWTKCEWVITYTFFHAIDWNKCWLGGIYDGLDKHENDTEAATVFVSRETFEITEVTTIYHNTTKSKSSEIVMRLPNHPVIEVDNQTHAAAPWGESVDGLGSGCHTNHDFYINYTFAGNGAAPYLDYTNKIGKYNLVDVYASGQIWSRRFDEDVMTEDNRLVGDDGAGEDRARAPWAWPFFDTCLPNMLHSERMDRFCGKTINLWNIPVYLGILYEFAPCANICVGCELRFREEEEVLKKSYILEVRQQASNGREMAPFSSGRSISHRVKSHMDELMLFPNPVSKNGELSVVFAAPKERATVQVISAKGLLVQELSVTGGRVVIDVNNLPSGTYFVRHLSEKAVLTRRFLVTTF